MGDDSSRHRGGRAWLESGADFRDLGDAGFDDRERGPEAAARDRLFVQNAFVTLSQPREVVWSGARAGWFAGAVAAAVVGMLLLVIVTGVLLDQRQRAQSLYGPTPVAGTLFEPVWPLILALGLMPFCAIVGALAALVRRWENQRRRALQHYFDPIRPRGDLSVFMALMTLLVVAGVYVLGLVTPRTDPVGLMVLAFGMGGLMALPVHSVWLAHFLPQIRRTGSASMDTILDCIRQQC